MLVVNAKGVGGLHWLAQRALDEPTTEEFELVGLAQRVFNADAEHCDEQQAHGERLR